MMNVVLRGWWRIIPLEVVLVMVMLSICRSRGVVAGVVGDSSSSTRLDMVL